MQRQLVSRHEIVRLINERISQHLNGGACTLRVVFWRPQSNPDGCNWLEGRINGGYTEGVRQAVREIRAKYNLEEE